MKTETVIFVEKIVGTFGAATGSAIGYAIGGSSGIIQGGLYGINAAFFLHNSLLAGKREKEINRIFMYAFQAICYAAQYYEFANALPGRCTIAPESLGCSTGKIFLSTFKFIFGFASLRAIYRSLDQYYHREQILKKWIIGKNKVQLVRKGSALESRVIDLSTKKVVQRTSIAKNIFTVKKIGEELKKTQVILRNFHNPTFAKPIHTWKFSGGRKEVHLLRDQHGLVFQVYNTYKKKFQQGGFAYSYKMSSNPDASRETQTCMDRFESLSDEELRKVCQEVKVHKIEKAEIPVKITRIPDVGFYHGRMSPFFLTFEPLSEKSRIDRRILLSHNYWGVTLIRNEGILDNHALIVIEGMRKGKYFMELTDFPGGEIRYEQVSRKKHKKEFNFNPEELNWEGRTSVNKRYRRQVEKMIRDIKQEKKIDDKLEEDDPRKLQLSRLGADSIFSNDGEESCFTWAKKKLRLVDIRFESFETDKLVSITMRHTYFPDEFEEDPYPKWRGLRRLGIPLSTENPKEI